MRRTAISVLLAIGLAAPALAQPAAQASTQAVRQAADQIASAYDHAYNSKSSSAMASLYAPDGVLVPPGRAPIRGRTAIKAYYQGRFGHGIGGHMSRIAQADPLGDGGFAVGEFRVEVPGPGGARHEVRGNLVYVLQHLPDGWKLRLVMASPTPAR